VLKDEPFLSSIQDHLLDLQKGDQEALTKSVLNQGSEKSVAIVNCSITNTTTDRNKRETILRKMLHSFIVNENWGKEKEANILDHVWARPDVFVIAGAENVDPDFLQEMIKFCEASKVKTIVSYDKVNDKNKHLLGQRGPVGVMAMSNWDDAELVSGVLGHTTVKKVTDEGDSVNVSVGSGEGESSNHPYNEHGGFRKAELSLGRSMNFPSDSTSFDQRKGYGNVDERKLSPQRIQRLSGERIYFVTRSETSPYGPLAFTLEQVEAAKAERERGFPAYDRDETGRYPSTAAMQQLAQEGRTEEVAFEESRRLPLSVQHRRIRRRIKARATQAQKEVEGEFSKDVLARRDRRNP
jgi:hypothetical protein